MKKFLTPYILRVQKFEKRVYSRRAAYITLCTLSFLYILPILLAGVDYIDDNARRVGGYYDWGNLGRYATEGIMHLLTFSGNTMMDPGRLMQVLSIPVLAYAGYSFSRALLDDKNQKFTAESLLAGAILVVNPFLIANLSFRYDSFSMILGYMLAILAGCKLASGNEWKSIFAGAVLLFISAALYQPMVLMCLVVAFVLILKKTAGRFTQSYQQVARVAGGFILGLGAYFTSLKVAPSASVGGPSRGVLVPINQSGFEQALDNFRHGIDTVLSVLSGMTGKILFLSIMTLLVIGVGMLVYKHFLFRQWSKITIIAAIPLILVISIMGPFVLMQSALTYQVRTLSAGVGMLLLLATLITIIHNNYFRYIGAIVVISTTAYFMNISYAYGSALSIQRDHDRAVYDELDDLILNNHEIQNAGVSLIGGSPSQPTSVRNIIQKRNIFSRLDIAGDNSTWYLWQRLRDERIISGEVEWYVQSKEQEEMRMQICKSNDAAVHSSPYYSVYRASNDMYIFWQHDPMQQNAFCANIR